MNEPLIYRFFRSSQWKSKILKNMVDLVVEELERNSRNSERRRMLELKCVQTCNKES